MVFFASDLIGFFLSRSAVSLSFIAPSRTTLPDMSLQSVKSGSNHFQSPRSGDTNFGCDSLEILKLICDCLMLKSQLRPVNA